MITIAVELGSGYISLFASARGLGKSITDELGGSVDKASGDAGDRAGKGFLSKFKLGLGGIAGIVGGAFAGVAVGGFLKDAVGEASGLNEAMNKVNVVFGDAAGGLIDFSENSASALGQSQGQALTALGTYGNLFKSMGLGTDVAAGMSKQLVQNAADLSSFNDASPEEALDALRAGLTGETEPLKRFGINLNDARLKAEALRLGLVESTVDQKKFSTATETVDKAARKSAEALKKYGDGSTEYADAVRDQEQANLALADVLEGNVPAALTAAEKAQASFSLIQQDAALASGDFAETLGSSVANQGRQLSAAFADLKAKIGTALLPIVLAAAKVLSEKLIPALSRLGEHVGPIVKEVTGGFKAMFAVFKNGGDSVTSSGFAGVMERIGLHLRNMALWVRADVIPALGSFAGWIRESLVPALQTAAVWVGENVVPVLRDMGRWMLDVGVPALRDFAAWLGPQLTPILQAVAERAAALWPHLKEIGTIIRDDVLPMLAQMWQRFNDDILPILKTVAEFIFQQLIPAYIEIQTKIDGYVLPVIGLLIQALVGFVQGTQETYDKVKTAFQGIADVIGGVRTKFDEVVSFVQDLPSRISSAASGMWDGIRDSFRGAINAVIGLWNNLEFPGISIKGVQVSPGFGTPNIGFMASGGVVTSPTLAVLGETARSRPEIVSPEHLLRDVFRSELDRTGPMVNIERISGPNLSADDVARTIAWRLRTAGV